MSVFVRFTDNLSSDTDTARSLNGQDVFNKANGKGQQESQTTKRLQQRLLSALFFGGTSSSVPRFSGSGVAQAFSSISSRRAPLRSCSMNVVE